jgi:hypothetical protein
MPLQLNFENSVRTVEKTFFSESIAYEIAQHNENCSSDLKLGPEISAASNSTPRWKLFFLDPKKLFELLSGKEPMDSNHRFRGFLICSEAGTR